MNEIETDRGDAFRSPLPQGFVSSPSAIVYLHSLKMCCARVGALECHWPGDRLNADATLPRAREKKGRVGCAISEYSCTAIPEQTA